MVTDLQSRRFAFDTTRRYTLEEYHRLVEDGILEEDARVELLEGRIVAMSPIRPRHQRIVTKLFKTFTRQERGRFVAEQDWPLPIPDHDEPEPDLLLYGRESHKKYWQCHISTIFESPRPFLDVS